MNLHSILGLSLAGVSLVCSIGFILHAPVVPAAKPDRPVAPSSYIEPMPDSGEESFRIHILSADGTEKEIRIKYKDASEGILQLGANGVHERRTFPDGKGRKEADFDKEGVLLSGYEFRGDRTLLWKTSLNGDQSKTVTQVFWPDGQLFLERTLERQSHVSDSVFYRNNGTIWQETSHQGSQLVVLKSFDENGRLQFLQQKVQETGEEAESSNLFNKSGPSPVFQVTYFNEDGKPDFAQSIAYAARWYWDPESGAPNPNPLYIVGLDVYSKGRLITQLLLGTNHRVRVIDNIHPDGAIQRLYAQHNGFITQEDFIKNGGVTTQFDYTGRFGKVPSLDNRYLVAMPDTDVPLKQFNEQEARLKSE